MVKIRDMAHGLCSQMRSLPRHDSATGDSVTLALCACPGFKSQDSLGLGAVCVHCGHLRVQHNRKAERQSATEATQ